MPKVFICYRRAESAYVASALYEKLVARFGRERVFMDVETVPPGIDYREHLAESVRRCDVLLALIGNEWLHAAREEGLGEGGRRLDEPGDFVRIELEAALARGIPTIPVLIDQARMPVAHELPPSLREFAYRNAAEVRPGRDFAHHLERLVHDLEGLRGREPPSAPPPATGPTPAGGPGAPASTDAVGLSWPAGAPRTPDGRPLLGQIVLLRELGRSTLGRVYLGYHSRLQIEVVVKVYPSEWESVAGTSFYQILADARFLARISTPHVVRVFEAGEDAGMGYVAYEYIPRAIPARDYLDRHPGGLPETDALEIIMAATRGLSAVHAAGVVHRDISPANILLPQAQSGKAELGAAKLVDFGCAQSLPGGDQAFPRVAGFVLTPYTAPESLGHSRVSSAADVYSMGASLYVLLTGRDPVDDTSAEDWAVNALLGKLTPLADLRPDITELTREIVERCLRREPNKRFRDGSELLAALEGARAGVRAV